MSSFSSGRLAVYKNTATNNKQKKKTTFSSLKNSVQIEPVWFRLDNLTLCAALTTARYCTRLKKIQRRRSFFPTNGTIFYIVFPKYRDKLSTKQKKFRETRDTMWHEIFAGSIFCDFSSDPQNNFLPKN